MWSTEVRTIGQTKFLYMDNLMSNLSVHLWNMELKHPVMVAAGPPGRDGEALLACARGGAAALVTKTISTNAASVPHPNMADFRTYFLNTELWSELPPEQWLETEYMKAKAAGLPIIISLGYTAADIALLAPKVRPYADALELSTHYISDDPRPMRDAIRAAKDSVDIPVLVKLSPFREIQRAAQAAQEANADGIVAVNSFGPALGIDIEHNGHLWMGGKGYGWISGPALKPIALRAIYDIAQTTDLPIIGVGGITCGTDVIEFLMAGASAVQVCTAAITKGPAVFGKIADEMDKWMEKHGYSSISEIQGLSLKQTAPKMEKEPIVILNNCTGCTVCVTSCVYNALFMKDAKIHLRIENCAHCGLCLSRCPTGALQMTT